MDAVHEGHLYPGLNLVRFVRRFGSTDWPRLKRGQFRPLSFTVEWMGRLTRGVGAWALLVGVFFSTGCVTAKQEPSRQTSKIEFSFANDERLTEHWEKHGRNPQEFNPTLTKEQYLQHAREFFKSEAKEILKKERPNGDRLRFRPSTKDFGVLSDRNIIRTYFRPSSGMKYWERQ